MGIIYILSVLLMLVLFVLIKKSDEKINLVSFCILSLITYLAYNIAICMIFGAMNITTNLLFLSIINLIISAGLRFKIYKDKKIQSFEINIKDFIAVVVAVIVVCYVAVDQYTPLSKTIANASVDASMHYSAATNFADNMKILSKIDNQTGYNFKTMQTGAYINTGIFMSVVRNVIPSIEDFVTFKLFEIGVFALNILAFYMLVESKVKSKVSFIFVNILMILYAYAYPYTSLLYGFSYLSVAIAFITGLFYLAKIYNKNVIPFYMELGLIVLMGIGIIFSYCLFVPAMFAFICIYAFIKDLKSDDKKVLKIFGKKTLLITGLLLVVTILAITYLVIPTFTNKDQNKLTDAIGFDGGIYKALYIDFLIYIPFAVCFIYRSIKNKELNFETVALSLAIFQCLISFIGVVNGIVSAYYYYKIYYIIWILLLDIAVNVICNVDENKELKTVFYSIIITWVLIILFAISGNEIKLQIKSPTLIESPKSITLAGIYYDTNIAMKANINVSCIVDANRVRLAEGMGKIDGITLNNLVTGGMNTNCKAWIYVISRITSGGASINELQIAKVETTVDEFLADSSKEFFVLFTGDKYENTEEYKVVFENEAGVILQKMHN